MREVQAGGGAAIATSKTSGADMKLEVVIIPVSDVDRAKRFYDGLGWRLDADFVVGDTFRVVQYTPPGSPSSIQFGMGVTSAAPGSTQGLFLVVSDIEAAHSDLARRGVEIGDVFYRAGPGKPVARGRDPERRSYFSYATFKGCGAVRQTAAFVRVLRTSAR
jgi:catechol 2,3-dioxygenase-like lactoylglutathione lyase family enzyme